MRQIRNKWLRIDTVVPSEDIYLWTATKDTVHMGFFRDGKFHQLGDKDIPGDLTHWKYICTPKLPDGNWPKGCDYDKSDEFVKPLYNLLPKIPPEE